MDSCKDTCEETELPDVGSIELDVNLFVQDGEYFNNWGVTDHYDSDYPICLQEGIDYVEVNGDTSKHSEEQEKKRVQTEIDENDVKKEERWISCKERLPEDRREVLVTAYWHETYQVMMASYFGDGLWWCVPFNNSGEHMQRLKPKAWMPLPIPYKAEIERE